ncbi:MAG TPA: hypothetical protein VJ719_08330 [Chthoniobacterales bacterium]|nr:hypothetical protein [Chthoniobacterales bacterium]
MKKTNFLVMLAGLIAGAASLAATVVVPPTFEQLVDQAQQIFQGRVTDVKSQWIGEGDQRHIVSYITFEVNDALKGAPGRTFTMRAFGGTVDGETMIIGDAPKFEVGDEDILFVENNGSQVIPLVGLMYGRFHVRKDQTGKAMMTTNEGRPLRNVSRLGREDATTGTEAALSPEAFKSAIRSRVGAAESNHSRH